MKTYKVKVRVDAWVEYTVEAESKADAIAEAGGLAEAGDLTEGAEVAEVVSYEVGRVELVKD
jgi:hypothetical protein